MLLDKIKKAFKPEFAGKTDIPEKGLRHFEKEIDGTISRYHLRTDTDGSGLLIANAAAACRLSPVGVVIAEEVLKGSDDSAIKKRLKRNFSGTSDERIRTDIEKVKETIKDMAFPGSKYPLFNLDDPEATSRGRSLSAPMSAEMGIDGTGDPSARIEKLWDIAVPQVVLIHLQGASENKIVAEKLVEGVEKAEDLGLIAGVRAPGSVLLEDNLLERLVQAGLDHVDVYWAGVDATYHDSLFGEGDHEAAKKVFSLAKELELCPLAVIPLAGGGLERIEDALAALPEMGVNSATAFIIAENDSESPESGEAMRPGAIRQALATMEETTDRLHINLVLAPPVERDPGMSLSEQVRRGPRAAGDASVRITPDGSVIPPYGPRKPVGNILNQPFNEIWSHDVFRHLRESVEEPESCEFCPGSAVCSTGCPADLRNWARTEASAEQ